jgi:hypothetical protein
MHQSSHLDLSGPPALISIPVAAQILGVLHGTCGANVAR